MKRIIILFLAMFMSMVGTKGLAHDFRYNGIFYSFNKNKTGVVVTHDNLNYSKYSGNITIPSSAEFFYDGKSYPVIEIESYAFKSCTNLKSVTIGNSVTRIGDEAFEDCSGLTNVTIPSSVTSIGNYAFRGCSKLTNVTIPNSVTFIGGYAFRDCSGLTSITIPSSVTDIYLGTFSGCSGLTSITIGNSVTRIGDEAFQGCSGLTSITIGNSVTSIGEGAFKECSGLTSITIGNSVTSIGEGAFTGCSNLTKAEFSGIERLCAIDFRSVSSNPLFYAHHLYINSTVIKSVTIPNTVTKIGNYTFYGCTDIRSVSISNSVTSIGDYAFYGCSKLASISIPNSLTSIGNYAFQGCPGLTSVSIPNSVTSIGSDAFKECIGLTKAEFSSIERLCSINFGSSYSNPLRYAHHLYINGEKVTAITIPSSVTSIGNYAFQGCFDLTSVTIPSSVTSIGSGAFGECLGLTKAEFSSIEQLCTIDFGSSSSNPLCHAYHLYINGEKVTAITIPSSVTSIGNYAFHGCSDLTSVTIPSSVTRIGSGAFSGCSSLMSVAIPNSVTSIGDRAFMACSGLTNVTIGNSVTSIGERAFFCCPQLNRVIVKKVKPASILDAVFTKDNYDDEEWTLQKVDVLYVPYGSKSNYQTHRFWNQCFVNIVEMDLVVLDENSTTVPENVHNMSVSMKRTINADEWSTLVLPFSMSERQVNTNFGIDVELADFTGFEVQKEGCEVTSIKVYFTNVSEIKANHPYIIKVSTPINSIEVEHVNIYVESNPSVDYSNGEVNGSFKGTYISDFDFYIEADYYPLFLSGNKFWYATANTKHMKAFRGYFDFNQVLTEASGARITMSVGNGSTGITSLYNSEMYHEVYDLQGRRVTLPSKGIYVRNGKKIIMK